MIGHWIRFLWDAMWPNMFAPSAITLAAIGVSHLRRAAAARGQHRERMAQADRHHTELQAQASRHQQELLDQAGAHHEALKAHVTATARPPVMRKERL